MKKFSGLLLVGCSALALAGCGADDVSSPGSGSIVINNPTPTPTSTSTSGTGTVTAASECPGTAATGGLTLTNDGTLEGPEGSWRVCTLPSLVNVTSTLPKRTGVVYRIHGRVDVGCDGGFTAPTSSYTTTTASCSSKVMTADDNVTLTIEPGVILYGENTSEAAWLAVNRGNKLIAEGTASKPIIFTSRQNILGSATDTSQGQWGGVVLLGRGVVTDCTQAGSTTLNNCERKTEGAVDPATFGGANNAYNAGSIKYVQFRYSGYSLSSGFELQALTAGGVGTGTTFEYIQSVNSSDDGAEFFGGGVNMKHYIAVNADDDSLDIDTGIQGNFQYLLLLQRDNGGDSMFEIDTASNEDNLPRNVSNIANFTAYQANVNTTANNGNQASILVRGNADITFVNGIVKAPTNECIRLHGTSTNSSAAATLKGYSTVLTCGGTSAFLSTGTYSGTDAADQFNSGSGNNTAFTSTLTDTFVNGTSETAVAAYSSITTLSSFFDNVAYIGAVANSSDTWYRGWTCDNATADFGSDSACTALPTT